MADKVLQEQVQKVEDIEFFNSFIKGQGSLYILKNCNKEKKDGKIINNGPIYTEHQWNPRPLNPTAIQHLMSATDGGNLIFSQFQQHALTVGVTMDLLEGVTLAKYQSNKFPSVVLANDTDGKLLIINGHHRIAMDKKVHANLLEQYAKYKKTLVGFEVTSDYDTSATIEAREMVAKIELTLWEVGQWGVVFVDKGGLLFNI